MATTDDSIKRNISQNITKYREQAGLSQKEFASRLKITPSRVSNWEQGANCPTIDMIFEICGILNVSINDIYGVYPNSNVKLTYAEKQHLEKYRFISEYSPSGAETVDYILNREYNVANQLKEDRPDLTIAQQDIRTIQYYQRLASAGSGEYLFDDIPTDTITVENTPISSEADFVIGVNGQSMEPTYYDGDLVFVKKASKIPVGEIGVFTKGNECFIKELGQDRLISHNPDESRYPDVLPDEEIRLVGLVLGRAEKI